MDDDTWFLDGVAPAVRAQTAAEAARLGVSLSDYLSEILLQNQDVADLLAPDPTGARVRRESTLAKARRPKPAPDPAAELAARMIAELQAMREAIEQRVADNAAETNARMRSAFADIHQEQSSLVQRCGQAETAAAHLTQAQVALTAELAHESQERRAEIQAALDLVGGVTSEMREQVSGALARLGQLETSAGSNASAARAVRDTFEGRLEWIGAEARAQAAKTQAAWAERAEASRADIERVEACTLAALEKLASDHAALARRSEDLAAQINDLRLDFEQTVLGIEQRSVGALEQIGQTVSVLEQRFAEAESPSARSA